MHALYSLQLTCAPFLGMFTSQSAYQGHSDYTCACVCMFFCLSYAETTQEPLEGLSQNLTENFAKRLCSHFNLHLDQKIIMAAMQ
jgi:hypothetical protein